MVAALNQLTWDGAYYIAVIFSALGLVAMGIIRAAEWWRARQRRKMIATVLITADTEKMRQAISDLNVAIGTAFYGPMSKMADALSDMAKALEPVARHMFPPGTVQNPSDPSPTPRNRRG